MIQDFLLFVFLPEEFWVDKSQCRYTDANGQTQNPSQPPYAEAVSAVKAIAIAQQQGQKIYTINREPLKTGQFLGFQPQHFTI